MSVRNPPYHDPGITGSPDSLDGIVDEFSREEMSQAQKETPPPQEGGDSPFEKTYIALDGITPDEIQSEHKTSIERQVFAHLLREGYVLDGVRLIEEDVNVIEIHGEE